MGPIPEKSACSDTEDTTYEPLNTFQELLDYGQKTEENKSLVDSVGDCLSLSLSITKSPTTPTVPCPHKTVPLNKNFSSTKVTFGGRQEKAEKCPKSMVCHDFRGGYLDDRFVDGTHNPENYIFRHWLQTDIFVYFSHHFVTIPTLGWINAAHSHGVKILGTIITEWDDGIKLCGQILEDTDSIKKSVEKLTQIAKDYGFEGYLVNIENELKENQVPLMLEFLQKLTKSLKNLSTDNLVIWYDSVTIEGKLKWQDSLNELNRAFFDACDGIYLNYGWNDEKLKLSSEMAGDRKFDVFVGIDVFGRGCYGGGGLNTCQAVEKVHSHDLSYAIFAPGWSFECHPYDLFPKMDDCLWMSCEDYFYFRCLKDEFHQINGSEILSPTTDSTGKKIKIFFSTDFSRGYGVKMFAFGKDPIDQPWFNLSHQSYQPCLSVSNLSQNNESSWEKLFYDTTTGFSGGGSLRINNSKRRCDYENVLKFAPIWFPLDISFPSSRLSIAVLAAWKSSSVDHQLQIYLEVIQDGMKTKKILLGSVDHLAASIAGKDSIHLKLSHFLQGQQDFCKTDETKDVDFFFRKNNYDEKDLNGWKISCFLFDLNEAQNPKYCGIKSIKVGADGDISLGYLSLAQIIHLTDMD